MTATLLDFVDRMGELRAGNAPSTGGSGGEDGGGVGALVLLPIALVVVGVVHLRRPAPPEGREAELAELKENVRDDLVALGDDIRALDLDVEMPGADPYAKADYGRAVEAYDRADGIWKTARAPEDFEPVAAALEEGRYAMTSAKARMEGREPPERTPPCFFDPRHGPSSREVEWAPYGGAERLVPACEADAQRVERGEDPQAREVLVGGRRTPYWNAGPMYAPFAGGYFGSAASCPGCWSGRSSAAPGAGRRRVGLGRRRRRRRRLGRRRLRRRWRRLRRRRRLRGRRLLAAASRARPRSRGPRRRRSRRPSRPGSSARARRR